MSIRIAALVALAGLAAGSPSVAQSLVMLPNGTTVTDITPDGEVIVGSNGGSGFIWRWRVDPAPTPILGGNAVAVSDDGTVVCGNIHPLQSGSTAGIWTAAAGWQDLGYLPTASGGCGGGLSTAYDISGDGTAVVGLSWVNGCDARGFFWTASTGMQELAGLANGQNRCSAISGDGLSLGGFAQSSFSRTPAYWVTDTTGYVLDQDLQGEVYGFTEDGSRSVGTLYFPGTGSTLSAFVRDADSGEITDLGKLQSTWAAAASDLSEDGKVIVGFDYLSLGHKAWVWTSGDGIVSLANRLAALGLTNLPNFLVCNAVSDDGRVVVGYAQPVGGTEFTIAGFIATLPEPVWTGLGGGLAGISGIPHLAGSGPLTAGSPTSVLLTQGKASATAAFVVGFSPANLPFKQGVLVPFPDVLLMIPALSTHGSVSLGFSWPAGVPAGFSLFWQVLVVDPAALAGVAISSALQSTTP